MQFLRKILDFYIFSNIHVALSGFCLTKITLLKFGIQSNLTPFFVAFSVLISYNFIRFFEIKTNRLNWFKQWFFVHKSGLLLVSILSSTFLAYIIFFSSFNLKAIVILLPFAFVTFFYVVPILKKEKLEFSFRNFPSIKIFSIAVSWAGVTVFFPLFEFGYSFTSNVYIEFVQRLFILIAITLPFDIRDVTVDPKTLKTLPQELGVNKSKIVGYVLLLLFVILEVIQRNYFNSKIVISIVIVFITALFLGFSTPKRTRYYTSFWVEAIPIFWFVLIALFL
ncbi:MAG: hypothetical protein GQ540_01305 [Lutibacter sp.]|uniref:hypothetical protein n=1 Tax=Lutibacter sp. TaxID=1925666 RepID=UPI0019DC974D|nr:hypothetical protein [Lutibacter sp.]NOR27147.1 hypothetical protein [Lutibacter sp.]